MSTLELKELSHPSGEVIKIAAGKTLDLKTQGSVTMPTGSVLQVLTSALSTQIATTATQGGGTFTLFNIPITPKSATSKICIDGVIYADSNNNWNGGMSCEKVGGGNTGFIYAVGSVGSTSTGNVNNFFNCDDGVGTGYQIIPIPFNLATNSGSTVATSIQFKLRGGTATNQTIYINRGSTTSNITTTSSIRIMEIQG